MRFCSTSTCFCFVSWLPSLCLWLLVESLIVWTLVPVLFLNSSTALPAQHPLPPPHLARISHNDVHLRILRIIPPPESNQALSLGLRGLSSSSTPLFYLFRSWNSPLWRWFWLSFAWLLCPAPQKCRSPQLAAVAQRIKLQPPRFHKVQLLIRRNNESRGAFTSELPEAWLVKAREKEEIRQSDLKWVGTASWSNKQQSYSPWEKPAWDCCRVWRSCIPLTAGALSGKRWWVVSCVYLQCYSSPHFGSLSCPRLLTVACVSLCYFLLGFNKCLMCAL